MDVNFEEEFCCKICQKTPGIFFFDGTAFGFRKSYVPTDALQNILEVEKSKRRYKIFSSWSLFSVKTPMLE